MSRLTFGLVLGFVALVCSAFFFYGSETASAEIEGDCSAFFNGIDVTPLDSTSPDDAITVTDDDVVDIVFISTAGFESHEVTVQFANVSGTKIEADSGDDDDGDTQWTEDVKIDDWDTWGAGLYRVEGSATLSDETECSGAVLIDVDKNPLTTVAGIVALVIGAFGALSVAAASVTSIFEGRRSSRKIEDWVLNEVEQVSAGRSYTPPNRGVLFGDLMDAWCLFMVLPAIILTGAAMASGGGPASAASINLPRASWRPRFSISGTIGGILLGLGVVVLLQQYGEIFPNLTTIIGYIVGGIALGIVLPSLIRVVNVLSLNRALTRAEARLAAAATGGGSGATPTAAPTPTPEPRSEAATDDVSTSDGKEDE